MAGPESEEALSLARCSKLQPWLIQDRRSTNQNYEFIDPINSVIEEKTVTEMGGKRLLGCFAEWVLLLDELTNECNFLSLVSFSEIHIPPFLHRLGSDCSYAFSLSSSPDSPDCLVTCVCTNQSIVHFCRIHDTSWTALPITDFDYTHNMIRCESIMYKGQLYILAAVWEVLVLDIASMPNDKVDHQRVFYYPESCPITSQTAQYLVECCDDLFLVRVHLCVGGQMVTNIEIYCLSEEGSDEDDNVLSWELVSDIGDNAFFLSGSYCASLCASEAGVEPNCVYFAWRCPDGLRLYKFFLEDQTFTFSLINSESDDESKQPRWVFTTSSSEREIIKPSANVEESNELSEKCEENDSEITISSRRWTDLPIELVELLFPRMSLVDCIRLSAVCKDWSSTTDLVAKANAWPWLMHSPDIVDGTCKFFDPINEREYTLKLGALPANEQLTFRFSRDGWVVITEGNSTTFILNPFTKEVIDLPQIDRCYFDGVSFTGIPLSLDFQVFGFYFDSDGSFVEVFSCCWGDEEWSVKLFSQDDETPFYGSQHNPVLYDGEFYCLDKRGTLGVLDPDNLTWRVLSKPEPIHSELSPPEDESCQLIKLHNDLIAVFRKDDTSAIRIFKLDWCRMSWTKLDDLGDFALFVGHQHSIAASSLPRSCNNSIYFPKFDGRDHRMGVHYSMEDQKYHPRFYDLQEPTISVWLQPNMVPTLMEN